MQTGPAGPHLLAPIRDVNPPMQPSQSMACISLRVIPLRVLLGNWQEREGNCLQQATTGLQGGHFHQEWAFGLALKPLFEMLAFHITVPTWVLVWLLNWLLLMCSLGSNRWCLKYLGHCPHVENQDWVAGSWLCPYPALFIVEIEGINHQWKISPHLLVSFCLKQ